MAKAKRSFKKDINQRVLIVSTFSLFLFDRLFVHIVYLSPLREKTTTKSGTFFNFSCVYRLLRRRNSYLCERIKKKNPLSPVYLIIKEPIKTTLCKEMS